MSEHTFSARRDALYTILRHAWKHPSLFDFDDLSVLPKPEKAEQLARAPAMREALTHLYKNVEGIVLSDSLGCAEYVGHTNVAVLRHWCDEARTALGEEATDE